MSFKKCGITNALDSSDLTSFFFLFFFKQERKDDSVDNDGIKYEDIHYADSLDETDMMSVFETSSCEASWNALYICI